ncbi:MAG: UDP-N-acetylmuramoyl-tripeptide--D-alanyl-D-alanine ligase [Candidatus Obscuribacterales bacterium]|nr:UDP-N-acetylmuramoyl-tripeptide--D-alanyl-D-alanine ligase [Candidatus Obscuribacterales bacterium]
MNEVAYGQKTNYQALFSLADLIAALPQAKLFGYEKGEIDSSIGAISTDSRGIATGQWYLALKGERFDGHRFVGDAIARGAVGLIVSDLTHVDEVQAKSGTRFLILQCSNTLEAYQAIATYHLKRVNPKVIAITGSSGKTTTKEMCASVFGAQFSVHKSAANENNEIGLPKTILLMPDDTQILVAEMAMRGLGQIDELASIAAPDVAIITNAGSAHIELLGSLDNIAKAKCELLSHLNVDSGLALIGNPAAHLVKRAKEVYSGEIILCDIEQLKENEVSFAVTSFKIQGLEQEFLIHAHGLAHLQDAWCAIRAALKLGMSAETVAIGLFAYHSIDGRGNCLTAENGATIIDESYNANPDSMRCAVSTMLDTRVFPQQKKIVILGDMGELGAQTDSLHLELGKWLRDKQISQLITVGIHSKRIADGAIGASYDIIHLSKNDEVVRLIGAELDQESCVIIKGSHAAQLETVVADLMSAPGRE